jgi:hypothetical protein
LLKTVARAHDSEVLDSLEIRFDFCLAWRRFLEFCLTSPQLSLFFVKAIARSRDILRSMLRLSLHELAIEHDLYVCLDLLDISALHLHGDGNRIFFLAVGSRIKIPGLPIDPEVFAGPRVKHML